MFISQQYPKPLCTVLYYHLMKKFSLKDHQFMQQALALAWEAKGKTFPNPAVGAVIVKNGKVISTGATNVWGGPHAEKEAIQKARVNAKNATLFVTLEPCCHYGRTPPCTNAIIEAGIKKVVFAVSDPNPVVNGKGSEQLKNAGVEVYGGLCEDEAYRINEDFFWNITQKTAWVTLKLAMTLDGRIADIHNGSKWISSEKAREYVHELRRTHAAVAVGRGTFDFDNPQLTVRHKTGYNPARILFSSNAKIPDKSHFLGNTDQIRTIIIQNRDKFGIKKNKFGIEIWRTGFENNVFSLKESLNIAYKENLTSIFFEGGQGIASSLLENNLVNRLYLFYGNKVIGDGLSGIKFAQGKPMEEALQLKNIETKTFDDTIMLTGLLQR